MSINRVNISGNLTRNAELRSTASGTQILSFGVAVTDRQKDKATGEWTDRTNWVDCLMFGNRATALADMLRKGTKVAIEGKLRYSSWERDGQRRSKLEVVVDEVEFMSRDGGTYQQPSPQQAQQPFTSAAPAPTPPAAAVYDEDIPF